MLTFKFVSRSLVIMISTIDKFNFMVIKSLDQTKIKLRIAKSSDDFELKAIHDLGLALNGPVSTLQ